MRASNHQLILLLEDDEGDQVLIQRCLRAASTPTRVTTVGSLEGAQKLLATERFDCILMDWNLPDATGIQAMEVLGEAVPVVVLTGGDQSMAETALQRGAQDYLLKDEITPSMLDKSIRYAIERTRAHRLRLRLQQTQRLGAIGQLAVGVAHEVNNPASWILTNQEAMRGLLTGLTLPEEAEKNLLELLDENTQGIQRIAAVVERLRRFASNQSLDEHARLSAAALLTDARTLVRSETRHRAEVLIDIAEKMPKVRGDESALIHLLVNLLLNACQALDDIPGGKGTIRMFAMRDGPTLQLGVEDSGQGIPEDLHERVLEPFFTTRASPDRNGLGLSIANEIAVRHGGTLHISRSPLGGARVAVSLPLIAPAEAPRPVAPTPPADAPLTARKILIVDDEPIIRRVLSRALRAHTVTQAASGLEALTTLREGEFDLILCDLSMPIVSGDQVFAEAISLDPQLRERFVIITGGAVTPNQRQFLKEEEPMVLEKPFTRTQLTALVARIPPR